jgi:deoxycytidylate deaminase
MIHAEENALLNTVISSWSLNDGAIAYITGKSCLRCLYRLWNKNITEVFYAESNYHFADQEDEKDDFDKFIEDVGIQVHAVSPALSWLKKPLKRLNLLDTNP